MMLHARTFLKEIVVANVDVFYMSTRVNVGMWNVRSANLRKNGKHFETLLWLNTVCMNIFQFQLKFKMTIFLCTACLLRYKQN